jgi:hypothetical protein
MSGRNFAAAAGLINKDHMASKSSIKKQKSISQSAIFYIGYHNTMTNQLVSSSACRSLSTSILCLMISFP